MPHFDVRPARRLFALACAGLAAAACGSDATAPKTVDFSTLSPGLLGSLDSAGQVMVDSNPTNPDLKALLDSTLLVLTAGVPVVQLQLNTNLTTAPLHFVGIHRAYVSATVSPFSTWTLVGFDDPAHLTSLVEVGGFNQVAGSTPPSSVTAAIGDGSGFVNGLLLQVAPSGKVTEWFATSGPVSFASDSATTGTPCPGFASTPTVTCTIETMHVHFTMNAPSTGTGVPARNASLPSDAAVPTMRLTYRF